MRGNGYDHNQRRCEARRRFDLDSVQRPERTVQRERLDARKGPESGERAELLPQYQRAASENTQNKQYRHLSAQYQFLVLHAPDPGDVYDLQQQQVLPAGSREQRV